MVTINFQWSNCRPPHNYPTVVVDGVGRFVNDAGLVFCDEAVAPPPQEEIAAAMRVLIAAARTRSAWLNSYHAKHLMEDANSVYSSNGAFIVAAHRAGIRLTAPDRCDVGVCIATNFAACQTEGACL